MGRNSSFEILPDLGRAIVGLPDGHPATRRTRAVARLLEAGLRPQEIIQLDADGGARASASGISTPDSSRVSVGGSESRGSRRVPRGSTAGHGDAGLLHVDKSVAAVLEKVGVKLRAHDFRNIAAIRIGSRSLPRWMVARQAVASGGQPETSNAVLISMETVA